MKQMRSRFRLLTLLLACAFLLVLAVCSGRILRESGVSLSSLLPSPSLPGAVSPDPSVSPDTPAETPADPDAGEDTAPGSFREFLQGTDNTPDPEYNTDGL